MVSNIVIPKPIECDILSCKQKGQQVYLTYVEEQITKADAKNIWTPIKKLQLSSWTNVTKKVQCKAGNKVVELRDDRSLFARFSIVAQSRPGIDLRELLGTYEFCAIPKALFVMPGEVHHCPKKSDLMHILEQLSVTAGPANIQTDIAAIDDDMDDVKYKCHGKSEAVDWYFIRLRPMMHSVIYFIIPSAVLLIFNILIIIKVASESWWVAKSANAIELQSLQKPRTVETEASKGRQSTAACSKYNVPTDDSKTTKAETNDAVANLSTQDEPHVRSTSHATGNRRVRSQHCRSQQPSINARWKISRRLTKLCLVLSFSFLVLTGPKIIWQVFLVRGAEANLSDDTRKLITRVLALVLLVNHTINFIFYLILIPSFRKDLMKKVSKHVYSERKSMKVFVFGEKVNKDVTGRA